MVETPVLKRQLSDIQRSIITEKINKKVKNQVLNATMFDDLSIIYHMGDITNAQAEVTVNQIVPELKLNVGMGRAFVNKCGQKILTDYQEALQKAKVETGMIIPTETYGKISSFYLLHIYLPSIENVDKQFKINSKEYKKAFKECIFKLLKMLEEKMFIKSIAIPLLGCGFVRDNTITGPLLLLETLYEYSQKFPRGEDNRTLETINIYAYNKKEYEKLMYNSTQFYLRQQN